MTAHARHGGGAHPPSAGAVLRVLSAVAPDRRLPVFDVTRSAPAPMAWLGAAESVLARFGSWSGSGELDAPVPLRTGSQLTGLARHDALTPGLGDLRLGWMWLVGSAEVAGAVRRLCLPLVSRPVHLTANPLMASMVTAGPWDLTSLVSDRERAAELEADPPWGGGALSDGMEQALLDHLAELTGWTRSVVAAAGLPSPSVVTPRPVAGLRVHADPTVVVGFAVYVDQPADPTHPRETLRNWSADPDLARTAFASLYLGSQGEEAAPAEDQDWPRSPFPLSDRQAQVVVAARGSRISVVSGPPGSGKSQTAAAVALDAVARGESVLVATQTAVAADVIAELLDRVDGPTPVLFGGGERANRLAAKLADGTEEVEADGAAPQLAELEVRVAELRRAVVADLESVDAAGIWAQRVLALTAHVDTAPELLGSDPSVRPTDAASLLAAARAPGRGRWSRHRRRRAERRLRSMIGAPPHRSLDDIGAAVDLAVLREQARRAAEADPGERQGRWEALLEVTAERDRSLATALAARVAARPDRAGRQAVAAMARALRSGRAVRRAHLAQIDIASLTRALPLWVGTLGDIESHLPAVAGSFDLVILDEASQIDQVAAAGSLLRARRAMVVGDPRQLRFVSFISDSEVARAIEAHDAGTVASSLDVRRVSAFDLAAGAAPVVFLDEHFRSVPHLIGFSARRFYDGRLLVATRNPVTESQVAVSLRHVATGQRIDGVNRPEVEEAIAIVQELATEHPTATIGVISPYRAQVDALEEAIGSHLSPEQLGSGRVRVGTVHGFQGAECDVVVASFGIGGRVDRGRSFLEDPNLFNVLVTRARKQLVALISGEAPDRGLLAEYLAWAAIAPPTQSGVPVEHRWTTQLAEVLADANVAVRTGYPVGRWSIDMVVGEAHGAIGVMTRVHPDGPEAHIRRHRALVLAGWRVVEVFPTDHQGDAVAAGLELRNELQRDERGRW